MLKKTIAWILACAMLSALIPAAVIAAGAGGGTYYSYADIVRRTYDMSYLATKPKAGEGGKQVTSTDRSSQYNEETGKYENWDANADWSGYEGINPDNGYRILADLEGPGYLTHIMTGQNWPGRLHIWIDGNLVIDAPFVDVVWGEYFSEFDQLSFKANNVNMNGFEDGYQGSINLAVPITYNESCLVEIDCDVRSSFYYTVGYYDLEDGASVEPFTWPMSDTNRTALKEANDALNDSSVPSGDVKFSGSVAPGETVTLYESGSSGAVSGTSLKINIPADEFDDKTSLVEWEIAMYWDGSTDPSVRMSVADFYGTPHGLDAFDNAGYGVAEDGTMYTTWYMPYNAAKITLTNNSDTARSVSASYVAEELTDAEADELMRFHAHWQRAYQRTDDRYPDAEWLYVEGEGRYVGVSHHVYQIVDSIWWGEGDEKFFVDGEKYPTWFGTGSEDYFWYAWCASTIFTKAYCGQPHNEGTPSNGNHQVQGHGDKVNYRVHVLDNVCFSQSFEACIDKYYPEDCVGYGDTTYFYLTKGTSANHVAQKQNMEERLFNNDMLSGETFFYPGAYLISRLIYSNTSVEPVVQGMSGVCEGVYEWFGDAHLFWTPASAGKYLEFELEIPETGEYNIELSMTNAYDYGQYSFYLDGEQIGTADFYGNPVAQTNVTLNTMTVTKGEHILKIACTGSNIASAGYYLGLNYLKFVPVEEAKEKETVSMKYSGSSGLLDVLAEYTSAESPHDQGLDPAISDDGSHLFWRPASGDEASFTVSVPKDGNYDITIAYTCFVDFGKFEVYMDGVKIGDTYDSYDTVLTVKNALIEDIALTEGEHTLTIRCVGRNDSAAGTVLGIDYVSFTAEIEKVPTVDVKYSGSSGLLDALKDYTSAEAPHDQGLDPAISDDGSHMFWRSANGDEANFTISIPGDGAYDMTVVFTCAGDFGQFDISIDGVKVGKTCDGYSAQVRVKQSLTKDVPLTEGEHTLTIKCIGKNENSGGTFIGIDYISFSMEITSDGDGGTPVEDNSGLYEAEKEAAKAELEAYAEAAYQTADEFQTPRIRRAVTAAKVEICQAATLEELAKLLADAKTEIDTVLATEYEEELEVDYDPDANLEIYYRGSSDLLRILSDYTTEEAPHDQGLTQSVSDDGSHLFWRPGVGDTMSFTVTIPADGAYDLEMPYTCYVDFGMFEVSLDGEKIGETYDAYNADAIITRPAVVKNLNLTKGDHTLTVKCVGKNDSSAGTVLGIDYVRFLGENAVTELDAYKQAAKDSLDTYKDSSGYSTDQWTAVQAEIAKQKALIDGCTAVDDVVDAWKAAKAALDAIPTGMVEYDDLQFDSTLTPGDYGWETDGGNYNGWQVVKENEFFDQVFFVEYDGTNSKRIWKDIIEDPDNFTVRFTVKVENWRAEIELMGVHIELNCEHGNGNQIFDRESWSWFDAKDQVCEVTATRENGGDLVFTLVGQGSDTPVVITKTAVNESDQNLYLGVIDATGSAFFHGFEPSEVDNGEPGQNPGEDPGKNPNEPPKTGDPVWAVIALLIVSSLSLTALINKKSLHR